MSKVIVSSYEKAQEAYAAHSPAYVISVLGDDEGEAPDFDGLAADKAIRLTGDCSKPEGLTARCQQLIDVAKEWDHKAPILIHCAEGVARSTAAAYVILCAAQPDRCEAKIAADLRKAAPHADPNLLLISKADALLERDDRMVEAILDLSPCAGAGAMDIVVLPLAA